MDGNSLRSRVNLIYDSVVADRNAIEALRALHLSDAARKRLSGQTFDVPHDAAKGGFGQTAQVLLH
jgi:hypothetical protein